MHVIATAGHVDHGKSTLVRALTGTDPDRFAEEKRRGLTIELGYAWTTLTDGDVAPIAADRRPSDRVLAFVDVPGHERFLGTMLSGLGPAPAVLFVVAADEGWCRQSTEHLAAVDALGIDRGLLVITCADRADPAGATDQAQERLAATSLGRLPAVAVSAPTGAGIAELRTALARLAGSMPAPQQDGRLRLWVDRSFSIRGAGTVVTGTLGRGRLRVGDELELPTAEAVRTVRVRGLQSLGADHDQVASVARVAVNLRDVDADSIGRGDPLLTPGAWPRTAIVDARCRAADLDRLPIELIAHLGTAAVPVRVRRLADDMVRLTLRRPLPCEPGDRLVLRDPSRHAVAGGAMILDVDPPELRRRGAARQRAVRLQQLATAGPQEQLRAAVRRRGAVRWAELIMLGVPVPDPPTDGVIATGAGPDRWLIDAEQWERWQKDLLTSVEERVRSTPLDPRLPVDAAAHAVGIPDRHLVRAIADAAGLRSDDGRLMLPQAADEHDLGAAEPAVRALEEHLRREPFAAPERPQLQEWGLDRRALAAAERVGRIVRLADDIVLLPTGPALAMRALAALPQPFTTSDARKALGTSRRVTIPLLEHLDRRGWTVRIDDSHRQVRSR